MKLYGYTNGDQSEKLFELDAVSICFQGLEEARKFANFANACANEIAALGEDYDHIHFAGGGTPDITIERLLDIKK